MSAKSATQSTITKNLAYAAIPAITLALSACGGGSNYAVETPAPVAMNQLYVQTNEATNKIVHFVRATNGALQAVESVATGGNGSNGLTPGTSKPVPDSLVSQFSVTLSADKKMLFAVNAGDNSISVFSVNPANGNLTLLKKNPTTNVYPNSLAWNNGYLYASFFTGTNQLSAFKVDNDGSLTQVGTYNIASQTGLQNVAPTQVLVDPSKSLLSVSAGVKSGALVSYKINPDGTLGTPVTNVLQAQDGSALVPFAGAFIPGANNTSTYLSTSIGDKGFYSYSYNNGGMVTRTGLAVSGEAAPCWISLTPKFNFAYVGNGAGSISSYSLDANGKPTLLQVDAIAGDDLGVAGDSWISGDGKFIYYVDLKNSAVASYSINADGTLKLINKVPVSTSTGLSLQGIAGI